MKIFYLFVGLGQIHLLLIRFYVTWLIVEFFEVCSLKLTVGYLPGSMTPLWAQKLLHQLLGGLTLNGFNQFER